MAGRVNQTQGVDALDISSVVHAGTNAVGIQGFHTSRFKGDEPRLLYLLKFMYANGTTQFVGVSDGSMNASCRAPSGESGRGGVYGLTRDVLW